MAGLSSSFPVYAPKADLEAYVGEVVANADGLLADASAVVRSHTKTAYYRVGEDGFTPTDTRLRNAFHDATILQAAALVSAKVSPGESVAAGGQTIQSKSLGGRSVTYAANASADTARAALLEGRLDPRAASVLSTNGLLGASVYTGGGTTYDILLRRWV